MSKKLLLADDSITIQKVIGIIFANEDYDLTIVDNGDDALEAARSDRPDLILADVFMPGKNGYELTAAVKGEPALRGVPVLLLSGTFEPFDEGKAQSVGADGWISKPFESQALIDRVEELLAAAPVALPETEPVAAVPPQSEAEDAGWGEPSDEELWGSVSFGEEDLMEETAAEEEPLEAAEEEFVFEEEPLELEGETPEAAEEEPVFAEEAPVAAEEEFVFEEEPLELEGETPEAAEEEPVFAEEALGAAEEEFVFEEEPLELEGEAPEAAEEEPVFAEEALGAAEEEFVFEEEPLELEGEAPEAAAEEFVFEEEEEILTLDEADILDEEELEPFVEEPLEAGAEGEPPAEVFVFEEEAEIGEPLEAVAAEEEFAWEEAETPFEEELQPAEFQQTVEEEFSLAEEGPEWGVAETSEETVAPLEVAQSSVAETQVRALSDEELETVVERIAGAVVERLAGSILEKIAWEVVPDLAESLIREELRKIKEGAA